MSEYMRKQKMQTWKDKCFRESITLGIVRPYRQSHDVFSLKILSLAASGNKPFSLANVSFERLFWAVAAALLSIRSF